MLTRTNVHEKDARASVYVDLSGNYFFSSGSSSVRFAGSIHHGIFLGVNIDG